MIGVSAVDRIEEAHLLGLRERASERVKERVSRDGAEMKKILKEIQSGEFAREWIGENRTGVAVLQAKRKMAKDELIEEVGERLRGMMPWIGTNKLVDKSKN